MTSRSPVRRTTQLFLVVALAVTVALSPLIDGAPVIDAWRMPVSGAVAVALSALFAWGIRRILGRRSADSDLSSAEPDAAASPAAPPKALPTGTAAASKAGSGALASLAQLLLAAAAVAGLWGAGSGGDLQDVCVGFSLLVAADVLALIFGSFTADPLGEARGRLDPWRRRALGAAVGLASVALLWGGSHLRIVEGGTSEVEWMGEPFRGSTATTALFLGLFVPAVIPAGLGGAFVTLGSGPRRGPFGWFPWAALSCARPLAHGWLLFKLFAGTPGLLYAALLIVYAAGPMAFLGRSVAGRASTLAYGALWAILGAQAAATERSADAFVQGLFGWAAPVFLLAAAVGFLGAERDGEPGLAPSGFFRLFPITTITSIVAALALAGVPFLLPFYGRATGTGALALNGSAGEALALAIAAAPLLVLGALPWLADLFFRPSVHLTAETAPVRRRRREPLVLLGVLVLGAAAIVVIGLAPDLLLPILPYGNLGAEVLPGPLGQLQMLLAAALVGTFATGWLRRASATLSSPQ